MVENRLMAGFETVSLWRHEVWKTVLTGFVFSCNLGYFLIDGLYWRQ